ncbi:MAG: sterol desaturase family protein, partial [Paracoccaceae bacterium]|nr:sterol desaturase family protein [Paracoccaceae bacterium]
MSDSQKPRENTAWNYHPELPLQDPSIFRWPLDPKFLITWFARNWLTLSERVMMVVLAVALWAFAYPSLETTTHFAFGWVAQIWVVNLLLMIVVAGGLHGYFYMLKGQGIELKFER